eukprot:jgi/Tetstr1/436192/TSEL_025037.t1
MLTSTTPSSASPAIGSALSGDSGSVHGERPGAEAGGHNTTEERAGRDFFRRSRNAAGPCGRTASSADSHVGGLPRLDARGRESSEDHLRREALLAELRAVVHRQEPGQHAEIKAMLIQLERGGALPEGHAESDATARRLAHQCNIDAGHMHPTGSSARQERRSSRWISKRRWRCGRPHPILGFAFVNEVTKHHREWYLTSVSFAVEAVLKIIVLGFAMHNGVRAEGMKLVVTAFFMSIPPLGNVVLVCHYAALRLIFSMLFVNLAPADMQRPTGSGGSLV